MAKMMVCYKRQYRGKYPTAIKSVWVTQIGCFCQTNDGEIYRALEGDAKVGADLSTVAKYTARITLSDVLSAMVAGSQDDE